MSFSRISKLFSQHLTPSENDRNLSRLQAVSVEEVSDAFDTLKLSKQIISPAESNIQPVNYQKPLCGRAYTVTFNSADKEPALGTTHDYLNYVPPNSVIFIKNIAGKAFSVWGSVLSNYAAQHDIRGTIIDGSARDVEQIQKMSYPVFAAGYACMRSTSRYKVSSTNESITLGEVLINPGDYILASQTGIAIIPPHMLTEVLRQAEKKKAAEKRVVKLIAQDFSFFEIDEKMRLPEVTAYRFSLWQKPVTAAIAGTIAVAAVTIGAAALMQL